MIFEWMKAKHIGDLKDLGTFKEVKLQVLDDLNLQGVITFRGYETLFNFIKKLRNFITNEFLSPELATYLTDCETKKNKVKFLDFKKFIMNELDLNGIISFKNRNAILTFIIQIQALEHKCQPINMKHDFFITEKHKLAFMLLNYNPVFDKELGIKRLHYLDKDKAREWRNRYIKIFHPDKGDDEQLTNEVSSMINLLYNRMVGKA